MRKKQTKQSWSDYEAETKLLGTFVPISVHTAFRIAAGEENLPAQALLRKLVVKYLDENGQQI